MDRYSKIHDKRPREIILLRGRGCAFTSCAFCDYHDDKSSDKEANFALNAEVLSHVTGEFGEIEIIDSGSVFELDDKTLDLIKETCEKTGITTIHFESHYNYRRFIPELRKRFEGINLVMKMGVETFDTDFRENVLKKHLDDSDPAIISQYFQEANFLFGITGQTVESMKRDIELGLTYFDRICVNIFCENTTSFKPDEAVIEAFMREIYPAYCDNDRVDILINNTDFGVGD